MLTIIETHPVQYHAPVYRSLVADFGIPVTVVYGSDFSVAGYNDKEFGSSFAWDTDLLSGYESVFLSRTAEGGAGNYDEVCPDGLLNTLKGIQPKAVMSIGYNHPYDRAGLLAAIRNGWPLFFRGETADHASARNWFKEKARNAILRQLYNRCAALLYLGQHSRQHYERLGADPEQLIFSPYCIDASTFKPSASDRARLRPQIRKELGIPEDRIVILFSGKLSYRKGVDLAVEAVRRFPAELRDSVTILFLGNGEQREALQARSQTAPAVDARFLGFQNQTDLTGYYHASDLLTLPSRTGETWGLVVNEALLHGLPCVVSEGVGSHPDLITSGTTGEVFPIDDVAAYSAALRSCIGYALEESTRNQCRARVEKYSVHNAAKGIATAYSRLVGRGASAK